jgi:hypothetical protein
MFPEETFLYASSYFPEGYAELNLESLGEDYLESLELLSDEIDIDPEALFTSIEGEYAIGVFVQDSGFFAELADLPLGVSMIIGTSDDNEWEQLFELMTDEMQSDGMAVVDEFSVDGFDLVSISMDFGYSNFPFFVYGTGNDFAVLSTEVENAEILAGDGDTLADSDDFQEVWEAFPEGGWPALYIDVEGFVAFIEEMSSSALLGSEVDESGNAAAVLEPLTTIAATSTGITYSDYKITTVILFIDR